MKIGVAYIKVTVGCDGRRLILKTLMALGTVIKTMENAGQFVFRCEANNSVDGTGRSSDTLLTIDGELL